MKLFRPDESSFEEAEILEFQEKSRIDDLIKQENKTVIFDKKLNNKQTENLDTKQSRNLIGNKKKLYIKKENHQINNSLFQLLKKILQRF